MTEPKFKWCQEAFQSSAYTKRVASNEYGYNKTRFAQDRYSAGAVIMELLGGTDLVLQAEKPHLMEGLLRLYRPYIHERLHDLLRDLLFDCAIVSYDDIASELCIHAPNTITESATKLDVAANEDGEFQKIIAAFRLRRKNCFKELEERYQLKAAELDPDTLEYR